MRDAASRPWSTTTCPRASPSGSPPTYRWWSTLDAELLARTIEEHAITGVVHLAAKKQVGESVDLPLHYYRENVEGLASLEAATATSVGSFVFSSAAVYGMPDVNLVTEETPAPP